MIFAHLQMEFVGREEVNSTVTMVRAVIHDRRLGRMGISNSIPFTNQLLTFTLT